MKTIGVALIGTGGIALANHVPGFALCPDTKIVALCDTSEAVLSRAVQQTGITTTSTDYRDILRRDDVDAIVVATPNVFHAPIVFDAVAAGKHVLCEKPLAMSREEANRMYRAAEAANVRHMTAFTYRFVPAMRYMQHLVERGNLGTPYHFRAQRFQDWGDRNLAWRQVRKLAGSGELGDMLSHRIDYGHLLIGPITRLVSQQRRFLDDRQGAPSDLDDWVSIICDFERNVTGVLESTKLATGRGEGHRGQDVCEVNGSEASFVFTTQEPLELRVGKKGDADLKTIAVPDEFLKIPGSPRDPKTGDPLATFRYDQNFEFISAIRDNRPCRPSFLEGVRMQAVMSAAIDSSEKRAWVDVIPTDDLTGGPH